jgi:hypothetical protein
VNMETDMVLWFGGEYGQEKKRELQIQSRDTTSLYRFVDVCAAGTPSPRCPRLVLHPFS